LRLPDRIIYFLLRKRGLTPDELEQAKVIQTFARNQLGLPLHVGQLFFAALVLARAVDGWTAKFLTLVLTSGNRAGKTTILAVLIIYSCLGKLNRPRPDESDEKQVLKWGRSEYHWYHFGIQHEVADLVFNEIVRILDSTHEGQVDGCPLTRKGPIEDHEGKEYGDYHWIRFRPEVGGAEVHFRTTSQKSLGQLGKDMHGISFDEAGLEPALQFLVKEVFGFRRLGTGGQLIMESTPSEELGTEFHDVWKQGDPENADRLPSWRSARMSTRDNIGYGLDQGMFDRLTADMDERTIRQNVEGEFLQAKAAYFNGVNVEACFYAELPERSPAKQRLVYLQGVDPAKSADSAWSIVLAVVTGGPNDEPVLVGVRAEQKKGQKSTESVVALVADAFNAYDVARLGSRCYTATDATGFGGKMFREALDKEVPQVFNVEFGGTVQKKRKLLGDLRTVIDSGRLILPASGIWQNVRKQLLGYKLEDRGIEQDAVMALVCAVWLLKRAPTDGEQAIEFDLTGAA